MVDIQKSWLIQRLKKPSQSKELDTPFTHSGPFTKAARKALGAAFTLDYMGSSEFEFGAIPKAIDRFVAQQKDLRASIIEVVIIATKSERDDVQYRLNGNRARQPHTSHDLSKENEELESIAEWLKDVHTVPVYILAPKELIAYAQKFVGKDSQRRYGGMKEMTFFRDSLLRNPNYENTAGWFELDNGFMFFSDKTMFENVAKIFGVKSDDNDLSATPTDALREAATTPAQKAAPQTLTAS